LLTSVRSFAQEQSRTPYELHLKTDLPAFGIAGAAAVIPLFYSSDVRKTCPCLPSAVNSFDRSATSNNSATLDKVSTGLVVAAVAWPTAAMFFDGGAPKDALTDALITGQAVLINVDLNQTIKFAVHRPRPLLYGSPSQADLENPHNYFSFYSQHTSVTLAAGISYARTFALRHPRSRYRWLVYSAAAGGGATVGSLRVLSGRHFPTDVITGAVAGT